MNWMVAGGVVWVGILVSAPLAAWADGPCTADIATLGRQLGNMPGLGGAISEPSAGLSVGAKTAQMPDAGAVTPSDRAQPGGASLVGGGSAGTVGGAGGPAGSGANNPVANGRIATSAADVRRQSEGKPTMAQQAALDARPGGAPAVDTAAADRVSKAKMTLQQAVDLNARGDTACEAAIGKVRKLVAKQ